MSIVLDALNKAENEHKKRSGKVIGADFEGHKVNELKKQYKALFFYVLMFNLVLFIFVVIYLLWNYTDKSRPALSENVVGSDANYIETTQNFSLPKAMESEDKIMDSGTETSADELGISGDTVKKGVEVTGLFKVSKNTIYFEDGEVLEISGIFENDDGMSIMLADEFLKIGETYKTITIKDVKENRVIVEHEGKIYEIKV